MNSRKSFIKRISNLITKNSIVDNETGSLFVTNPGISYEALHGLAKKHGFFIAQTNDGEYISIPTSYKYNSKDINLYDNFMETYSAFSKNFETLLGAYKTFDLMDENLAEIGLILDTYAAEVLSQGFVENPIKISVSDSNAQEILQKVFSRNRILSRVFTLTRNLAKYGNFGMILSYPALEQRLLNTDNLDISQIDVVEDLNISFINPKYYKINTDVYGNIINYQTSVVDTYTDGQGLSPFDNKIWQPWQFTAFKLDDDITEPYGKSMLWTMRSAFDQLTTLEALLGISRASNLQRLVFYVPIPRGMSVMDSAEILNTFKSNYLNSAFTDQGAIRNGRKIPGANSILVLPESSDGKRVSVDHLEAKIDLSSTEDVEYFLDKLLNSSSLSKGYLNGDETITTSQTLETQDLKLRRTLLPLKTGLLNGIMSLAENVLTHAGYDVSKLNIKVTLNQPIQVSADTLEKYGAITDLLKSLNELNEGMSNINKFQLLIKLGLDPIIARLVCSTDPISVMDDNIDTLANFLKNQTVHEKQNGATELYGESINSSITSIEHLSNNKYFANKLQDFYKSSKSDQRVSLNEDNIYMGKKVILKENKNNV